MNAVLDAGINFIDTARSYGLSEQYIGSYIADRRSEYFLATKGGRYQAGEADWTEEHLFRGMDESLQRLQVDCVDTLQLHSPTVEEVERGNLVAGLRKLREQGKVRWLGNSTRLPDLPTFLEWGVFDVFQIPYSALERTHEDLITKAAEGRHWHGHPRRRGQGRAGVPAGGAPRRGASSRRRTWMSSARPGRAAPRSCCGSR